MRHLLPDTGNPLLVKWKKDGSAHIEVRVVESRLTQQEADLLERALIRQYRKAQLIFNMHRGGAWEDGRHVGNPYAIWKGAQTRIRNAEKRRAKKERRRQAKLDAAEQT